MNSKPPTHVVFASIHPRAEFVVPTADAFTFWDTVNLMNKGWDQRINGIYAYQREVEGREARGEHTSVSSETLKALDQPTLDLLHTARVSLEISHVIWDNDPKQKTFAKALMVWDFESLTHRLSTIAIGCYSRSGVENPELGYLTDINLTKVNPEFTGKWTRITQHLVNNNWVSGINWDRRDKREYPDPKEEATA